MKLKRVTQASMPKVGADFICSQIKTLLKSQTSVVLALAGGRSAQALCEQLRKKDISWNKVHVFILDERLVPITDSESNFRLIKESLLDHVAIPKTNIYPFVYDTLSPHDGADHYAQELDALGGTFDILFASSGEDGHIAGLYPNHPVLRIKHKSFVTFHDSPKPPAHRMTSTVDLIVQTKAALLLFSGAAKKQALAHFRNAKIAAKDCPAKYLQKTQNLLVLTDIK
ncbi:MAG TPA: 6-phosphogluconolactonase [Acidobacteriota bacterium]|nr:6-phosphogluconolactonase [Acidobacteriota bacterium]